MECPPYDMSVVDPFYVLDEDLNDVSEVIRNNHIWTGMESGVEAMQWQPAPSTAPSTAHQNATHWVMPEDGRRQLTPPGVYYQDQKNREIGSIVSLLQSDSPPRDQYNPHFSPPHFQGDPMWGGSTSNQQPQTYTYSMQNELLPPVGRLLPELSGTPLTIEPLSLSSPMGMPSPGAHTLVEIGTAQTSQHGLAHHLSMPAMQPPPSPLTIEPLSLSSPIAAQMGSPRMDDAMEQRNTMVPSPPTVFGSSISPPITQKTRRERKPLLLVKSEPKEFVMPSEEGNKEILVKLLESNNIRTVTSPNGCETKPRPSGVALRVTSSSGGLQNGQILQLGLLRTTSAPSFDDEDEDDDDEMLDDDPDRPPPTKKGPKTERRTAHNLIEKKYRCSINDRIQQMKVMLAGDEAKLSKSATLRRGLEHIEMQDRAIRELQYEVHFLRNLLAQNNIEVPPLTAGSIEDPISPISTRSSSTVASPHSSPLSSPKSGKRARARDESRLGLFAIMLAVLFFNPLSLVSLSGWTSASSDNSPSYTPEHHSRVLRSDYGDEAPFEASYQSEDEWYTSNFVRGIFIWTVNAFVVICILTRLLVYGEPVQDLKSTTWTEFIAVRNKARESLEKGLLREAHRNLVDALSILDRPLPSAGIETMISITWQVIRHLLNSMWIGRWLARRGRDAEKPQPVVCRSHAHTALVYHKLHQLSLLSPEAFPSRFCSLHLSLSAVNLAESAGAGRDGLPRAVQAAIYLGAALSVRLTLPRYLGSMTALYFVKRAKRHLRRADQNTVSGLLWTVHPVARRFLSESARVNQILTTRNVDSRPFVAPTDPGNALERLRDSFKANLIKMLLDELQSDTTPKIDVADISQLLLSLCTETPQTAEIDKMLVDPFLKTVTTGDPICLWWTHVLSCALYWRAGDTARAKTHYTLVRQCPSQLLDNQLALAVGHAFCSRKLCIDNRDNKNFAPLVALHSRKALEALRTVVARPAMPQVSHVQESLRQLSYEWILSSVLDGWRGCLDAKNPYWTSRQSAEFRTLYQEAYNHYQFIADQQKGVELKCSIYRMTCRMLNGANPIYTFTCLQRLRREIQNRDATKMLFRREDAPDRYHMHVLTKLHSDINSIAAKRR